MITWKGFPFPLKVYSFCRMLTTFVKNEAPYLGADEYKKLAKKDWDSREIIRADEKSSTEYVRIAKVN